jgi:hypothetical protein
VHGISASHQEVDGLGTSGVATLDEHRLRTQGAKLESLSRLPFLIDRNGFIQKRCRFRQIGSEDSHSRQQIAPHCLTTVSIEQGGAGR